jgi:hypothetical protein
VNFVPIILVTAFVAGFFLAGKWCKSIAAQIFVGIFLGVGFVAVLCGVIFAGCLVVLSSGGGGSLLR